MRLLFLGDIVGRSGRQAVLERLIYLRQVLAPDLIIANAENAAGGYGLTDKIARELLAAGVDCLTMGNHLWDQKELVHTIEQLPAILRPLNYPPSTPGRGSIVLEIQRPGPAVGQRVLVVSIIARLFMEPSDDPFAAVNKLLERFRLGREVQSIAVDFHGEATSEKMAMGHFLDGRVSMMVGTHTHVPSADHQILPGGSGYISDVGMCGDYDSVIGMNKETALARFLRKTPTARLTPGLQEATVCGVLCQTGDGGLAKSIEPIRIGGRLSPTQ